MNSEVFRSASTSVVFPAPDGAESTKRIPLRVNRLLKVLDLLADFFQLRFAENDPLRNCGVVRFRAERVQFAKDFLGNEFERASDRFVPAKMMRELREMALCARQLFRDIGAIREESDFLHQTLILSRNRKPGFLNAFEQHGPEFFYDFGMQFADFLDLLA